MALYKEYNGKKVVGVYTMGYCGVVFMNPEKEDRYKCDFITAWFDSNGTRDFRRSTVKYTENGRPYINRFNQRVYMDNVMRTEF